MPGRGCRASTSRASSPFSAVAADIAERKARQKALVEEWGLDVVSTALDGVAEPRAKQATPKPAQRHPSDQEAVNDVDGALATGEEGEVVAAR